MNCDWTTIPPNVPLKVVMDAPFYGRGKYSWQKDAWVGQYAMEAIEYWGADCYYLYAVYDKERDRTKIGISKRPDQRIKALSETVSLRVLCCFKLESRFLAETLEAFVHKHFEDVRIDTGRGKEWFRIEGAGDWKGSLWASPVGGVVYHILIDRLRCHCHSETGFWEYDAAEDHDPNLRCLRRMARAEEYWSVFGPLPEKPSLDWKQQSRRNQRRYYSEAFRQQRSQATTQMWNDPEKRPAIVARIHKVTRSAEFRKSRSEAMKKILADPERRQKYTERILILNNSPEVRERRRQYMNERWKDPEYQKNQSIKLKAAHARRPKAAKPKQQRSRVRWDNPDQLKFDF